MLIMFKVYRIEIVLNRALVYHLSHYFSRVKSPIHAVGNQKT